MDSEYDTEAEQYQNDIDFAFFFVNFGTSKSEYLDLTRREKAFIIKAWEDKLIRETTYNRNATLNAVSNALRKKSARFVELWKKAQQPVDIEMVATHLEIIERVEEADGKSWVDAIYKANGMKKPKRRRE